MSEYSGSLNKALVEQIFDAASIRRWNDQINPMEFTELDKQAHKTIIAWVLARCEEDNGNGGFNWRLLIEGALFELLQRVILTDIKPPVFHKMMAENGRQVNDWVLSELEPLVNSVSGGFAIRMRRYFTENDYAAREKRILHAAHYLATQWEFSILYKLCPFIRGVERIKQEIEEQLEDHIDLIGVQKINMGRKTAGFVDLCGQLRWQKRWSQSPRIPATSVLGHMFMVAVLTYLALCDTDACDARIVAGFHGALFHDLPEALTRDITSPVKNGVEGLADTIKKYENLQMEDKIQPLVPAAWYRDLNYFTDNEFENRIIENGEIRTGLTFQQLDAEYNDERYFPVDGEVICACDKLAAFIEATESIHNGITSKHLKEGVDRLWEHYRSSRVGAVDFGNVFRQFKELIDK
ncbi:MAG: HD domain-containing protein [Victivallales bacterium]|nr:HD domain-containing protein [Victivallales bacterium]